jgi:hypothetical protein
MSYHVFASTRETRSAGRPCRRCTASHIYRFEVDQILSHTWSPGVAFGQSSRVIADGRRERRNVVARAIRKQGRHFDRFRMHLHALACSGGAPRQLTGKLVRDLWV